jgi:hypothetical protein
VRDEVAQILAALDRMVDDGSAIRLGENAYRIVDRAAAESTWIDERKRGAQADQ